jgi:hypothetical protein
LRLGAVVETGLHLAGNHDNTNHHGGKLRLTKFAADKSTGRFTSVFYQEGGTQEGNTVLVSGCRVSSATRGFKFQAFKTLNFDNVISTSDVDTLAYIGRNGINVIGGTYQIDGAQITHSDLAGTIATDGPDTVPARESDYERYVRRGPDTCATHVGAERRGHAR